MTIPTGHAFVGNRSALEDGQSNIGFSTGILTSSRWETVSIQPQDMHLIEYLGYPYYYFASSNEFGGIMFPNNEPLARAEATATFPSSRKIDSRIYPYINYVQTSAIDIDMTLSVALFFPGPDFEVHFETFLMGRTKIYSYTSGNMLQTTIPFGTPYYPQTSIGNDKIGGTVEMTLYIPSTGGGETMITEIGFYYEMDSFGSEGQRSK